MNDSPNSLAWPDDAAIGEAFATTSYYGNFTQERIRLPLGSIDAQVRIENKKTEPAVFDYGRCRSSTSCPGPGRSTGRFRVPRVWVRLTEPLLRRNVMLSCTGGAI